MSVSLALVPVAIAVAGAIATREKQQQDPSRSFRLETRMKDEELLRTALERYGCKSVEMGETIGAALGDMSIRFERSERDVFEALFIGDIPIEHARTFLTELDEEHTLLVQQRVYKDLLSRAKDKGMTVESEEFREDNSVVITLLV